ncbi:hypothetical protein NDU88_005490 [Pleurodeles waltl]|uniref:Uncharacterized protein n=1 Tax=Pleurodeles waltl TaxID=8319 RepID=A0AAV7UIB3_PLEWA|nr:hypothetical protein NDU88_005490 [Pleurodeles waltl]
MDISGGGRMKRCAVPRVYRRYRWVVSCAQHFTANRPRSANDLECGNQQSLQAYLRKAGRPVQVPWGSFT